MSTPEGTILKSILEYLSVIGMWHMRMNTGAMSGSHNSKRWFVKFCKPGTADILAIATSDKEWGKDKLQWVVWFEVKTPTGKQSEEQKSFQAEVEAEGHAYHVVRSIEDVKEVLGCR